MKSMTATSRQHLVRRGRRLEYFTLVWNSLEGVVSIIAGLIAGSVALVSFGLDSVIEVASGAALLWGFTTISTHPGVNGWSAPRCESSAGASWPWRCTSLTNPALR